MSTAAALPPRRFALELQIAIAAVALVVAGYTYPALPVAVLGIAFLVLAFVETWSAFLLMVFTLSINLYVDLGIPIRDVSALMRLALFAIVAARAPQRLLSFPRRWAVLSALYVAIAFITAWRAGLDDFSERSLFRLAAQMCFALSAFVLIDTKERFKQFAAVLAISILPLVLFSVVQVLNGGYTELLFALNTEPESLPDWSGRAPSFLTHFNVAAGFLNLCIPYVLLLRTARWKKWALVGTGIFGVVLTQSRGGMIGTLTVLLAMAAMLPGSRRQRVRAVLGMLAVIVVLVSAALLFAQRLGKADTDTDPWRLIYAFLALKMWLTAPLLGVGFAHFRVLKLDYLPSAAAVDETHNIYLQLLVETGIAGFATFFAVVFSALRQAFRLHTYEGKIVFIALLGALVHGFMDTFFLQSPQFGYLFFLQIALVAVLANLSQPSSNASSAE